MVGKVEKKFIYTILLGFFFDLVRKQRQMSKRRRETDRLTIEDSTSRKRLKLTVGQQLHQARRECKRLGQRVKKLEGENAKLRGANQALRNQTTLSTRSTTTATGEERQDEKDEKEEPSTTFGQVDQLIKGIRKLTLGDTFYVHAKDVFHACQQPIRSDFHTCIKRILAKTAFEEVGFVQTKSPLEPRRKEMWLSKPAIRFLLDVYWATVLAAPQQALLKTILAS